MASYLEGASFVPGCSSCSFQQTFERVDLREPSCSLLGAASPAALTVDAVIIGAEQAADYVVAAAVAVAAVKAVVVVAFVTSDGVL